MVIRTRSGQATGRGLGGGHKSRGRAPGSQEFSKAPPLALHQMHPTPHHPVSVCFESLAGKGASGPGIRVPGQHIHPINPSSLFKTQYSLGLEVKWGGLCPSFPQSAPPRPLLQQLDPLALLAFHGNQMFPRQPWWGYEEGLVPDSPLPYGPHH